MTVSVIVVMLRVDALELASGGEMSASRCGECAHMPIDHVRDPLEAL